MGFFKSVTTSVSTWWKNQGRTPSKGRSLISKLNRRYTYRGMLEMQRLVNALMAAESVTRPDRRELYAVYRQVELDDQVTTQQEVALVAMQRAPFEVLDKSGKPNEELHEIFETSWFTDIIEYWRQAEDWGHNLIELETDKEGKFVRAQCIPRDHVIPEFGVVVQEPGANAGYPFRENPSKFLLLEAGGTHTLGRLHKIAIPVIRKRYSDEDWSMYSERFGMPLLDIGSDSRDTKEMDRLERFASEFGRNGWIIRGKDDEVKFQQPTTMGTGHHIYRDRIEMADKQIARLLNGQTSTSDEKAFVGSAEVHERVLNDFTFRRLRLFQNWVNTQFIPLAASKGYPELNEVKLMFTELAKKDAEDGKGKDPKLEPGKKKAQPKVELSFDVGEYYADAGVCCDAPEDIELAYTKDDMTAATARIAKLAAADFSETEWDPTTFEEVWPEFGQALTDGWGHDWKNIDRSIPGWEALVRLRQNTIHLLAGKTTALIRNYRQLLTVSGKAAADQFVELNLRSHMQTELNHVRALAQAQVNWRQHQALADVLPNLKYSTAGDDRVRDAHRALDQLIYPLDHPFWDLYYPPNGFNCRCDVTQVDEDPTVGEAPTPEEAGVPFAFRQNPGKTGDVFPKPGEGFKPHTYFNKTSTARAAAVATIAKMPAFDVLELAATHKGTPIKAHLLRDLGQPGLYEQELFGAQHYAEQSDVDEVVMRFEHFPGEPSADLALLKDGKHFAFAEVKTLPGTGRYVAKQALKAALAQGSNSVALVFGNLSIEKVEDQIRKTGYRKGLQISYFAEGVWKEWSE